MATSEYEPWRDLNGKIVMVTGASSGSGWKFCIDLAKSGCKIIVVARRVGRLKALCDEINKLDISGDRDHKSEDVNDNVVRAVAVELDVSAGGPTIEAAVRKAWEVFGRIDVLINNAGITGPARSPLDLSEQDWHLTFRTNVRGAWLVSKYVCLQMCAFKQEGSVINISSASGLNRVYPYGAIAYASSKSALDTMTKVMAMELGKHKIRVNSIAPGLFKSEITKTLFQNKRIKNVASNIAPLKEFGTIDPALTSLVRYLIHDSSSHISGNIFIVDSGISLSGVPLYSSL